jgi:hypothetical protein
MRPISALSLVAALAVAGCAISRDTVVGDGHVVSEQRAVGNVTALDMRGPLTVEVRVGEAPSLRVEADANLLPLIRTETVGGTLRMTVDKQVRSMHSLRVIWTAPQLAQLTQSGSGRLTVAGLQGGPLTLTKSGSGDAHLAGRVGALNIQASGSGDVDGRELHSGNANLSLAGSGSINVGDVTADALNVKVRGSGELQAGGAVAQLNAKVVGSGDARLKSLASAHAELSTTGSGDISAQVGRSLIAQTTGSGRITVYGNPAQRSITGRHVDVIDPAPASSL